MYYTHHNDYCNQNIKCMNYQNTLLSLCWFVCICHDCSYRWNDLGLTLGQTGGMFALIWIYACLWACLWYAIHHDFKLFLWFPIHGYIAMAMAGLCLNRWSESATFDAFDQQKVSLHCFIACADCLELLLELGGSNLTWNYCQYCNVTIGFCSINLNDMYN